MFVFEKDAHHSPLVTITPEVLVNEDEAPAKPKMSPLLMCKVPSMEVPDGNGGTTSIYKPEKLASKYAGYQVKGAIHATKLVDMSVDPSICLLPSQLNDEIQSLKTTYQQDMLDAFDESQTIKDDDGRLTRGRKKFTRFLSYITPHRYVTQAAAVLEEEVTENMFTVNAMDAYGNSIEERKIGNIYINIQYLIDLYKEMTENETSDDNEMNFNLFDYIKKIWEDINKATGNIHKFEVHCDFERPNIVRVVDLQYQQEQDLKPENLYELKIQSNESVCRDFSYHSIIPSALSATIGISVQNPDNVNDLDQVTFAALSKNVRSRFHVPKDNDKKIGQKEPSEKKREQKSAKYDADLTEIKDLLESLFHHRIKIMNGEFSSKSEEQEKECKKQSKNIKRVNVLINKLHTLYAKDGTHSDGSNYYKGFFKKNNATPPMSAVIPLKFDAKVDGIGGIVIGNIFRIDPTRLPIMYQKANIGFAVMGESQDISAGGDWNTSFKGQLILLPGEDDVPPADSTQGINLSEIGEDLANIGKKIVDAHQKIGGAVVDAAKNLLGIEDGSPPDTEDVEGTTQEKVNGNESIDQKAQNLEKQNTCPEGHYWSEETQRCVPENEDDVINNDVPEGVVISAVNPEVPIAVRPFDYKGPLKEIKLYTYKGQAGTYVISVDDSARPYKDSVGNEYDCIIYVSDVLDPKDDVVREIINDFGKNGRYKSYISSDQSYQQNPIPNPNRLSVDSETLPVPMNDLVDAMKNMINNIQEYEYNFWDGYDTDPEWNGNEEPPSIDQNGNPTGWNPNITPGGNNVGNPDNFA